MDNPWRVPRPPIFARKCRAMKKGSSRWHGTQNPNSAGSQFYICLSSDPTRYAHLNGSYTTFGKVIEGIAVVDALREGDVMQRVAIENYQD